jgi:hypothetical protein
VANFSAVYDACVPYPAPLRDLLLQLALTDLFRAHWTADIHKDWMRNVAADRPDIAAEQLERTRELMDAYVRDCLVEGYESLIPSLDLPDDDDRQYWRPPSLPVPTLPARVTDTSVVHSHLLLLLHFFSVS